MLAVCTQAFFHKVLSIWEARSQFVYASVDAHGLCCRRIATCLFAALLCSQDLEHCRRYNYWQVVARV